MSILLSWGGRAIMKKTLSDLSTVEEQRVLESC